jgi:hypothetical protein
MPTTGMRAARPSRAGADAWEWCRCFHPAVRDANPGRVKFADKLNYLFDAAMGITSS